MDGETVDVCGACGSEDREIRRLLYGSPFSFSFACRDAFHDGGQAYARPRALVERDRRESANGG